MKALIDFREVGTALSWMTVNDEVMGGISKGRFKVSPEGVAVFFGHLSLENNGGFASVRTVPNDFGLAGAAGLAIRVRGDGRTYRLRVRTDDRFDGVAFQSAFETRPGEWLEITAPFDRFEASFRGRKVTQTEPLDPAGIRQIGFMLADKTPGAFRLEIDWIRAYRPGEPEPD